VPPYGLIFIFCSGERGSGNGALVGVDGRGMEGSSAVRSIHSVLESSSPLSSFLARVQRRAGFAMYTLSRDSILIFERATYALFFWVSSMMVQRWNQPHHQSKLTPVVCAVAGLGKKVRLQD
jgi:hypothetical protein